MVDIFHSELITFDNDELAGPEGFLEDNDVGDIIVYSRDWTVETVVNQIIKGNIELNPDFQRRNAWNDPKKSSLIESYLIGYPVPEIVLAEHPKERKKFIVIDGKQRLLTLCGFLINDKFNSWKKPKLSGLKDLKELNNKSFVDFKKDPNLNKYLRLLANADVRCTVISNVKNNDVLYDIFYRLNAGATPLSTQELRQVLHAGEFTKYLVEYTSELSGIHKVLKLDKPDDRLKDIETLLRVLSMINGIDNYTGNLKRHLDNYTVQVNEGWDNQAESITGSLKKIDETIDTLAELMGGYNNIGRKWNFEKDDYDTRFNTVLFEVQIYFGFLSKNIGEVSSEDYTNEFKRISEDSNFISSISTSTKNIREYQERFRTYSNLFSTLCNEEIQHPWMD